MKKRWLSILLVCGMLLTTLPSAVFAEGEEGAECVCTAACTAEVRNADCPTCGAEDAALEDCAQYKGKQENELKNTQEPADPQKDDQEGDQEAQPEEAKPTEPTEEPAVQEEPTVQEKPQVAAKVAANNKAVAVQAAEHKHCFCGGSVNAGDHTSHEDVTYKACTKANYLRQIFYIENVDVAYAYLENDMTLDYNLSIQEGKTLYLCLNGHTLNLGEYTILVGSRGAKLYLCDCSAQKTGTVSGGGSKGCVSVYDAADYKATFNMYGGTLRDGNRSSGGGVDVEIGTMNMYGGTITENTATRDGGGIYVGAKSALNLYGGTITKNTVSTNEGCHGGGVYVESNEWSGVGKISISGSPVITGNTRTYTDAKTGASATTTENLYLSYGFYNSGKFPTITLGTLTGGANIGISTGLCVFSTANETDYSEYFSSDDAGRHVEYNAEKKLELKSGAAHVHSGGTPYCNKKAICTSCGKEYGAFDPANHSGTLGDWQTDDGEHWKEYSCCHVKAEKAAHDGGTVDCQHKAVCTTCDREYGTLADHDYDTDVWGYQDENSHAHRCKNCDAHDTLAKHTPDHEGHATEEYPIKCTECGYEIEAQLVHTHSYTQEVVKDAALKSPASCTAKAVYYKSCTCGEVSKNDSETFAYGEMAAHDFTAEVAEEDYLKSPATCTTKAVYYKSCAACGLSSKGMADEATFVSGDVLGHDWGEAEYTWSMVGDVMCSATKACKKCPKSISAVSNVATYAVVTPATCLTDGLGRYTATFTVDDFPTQTKDVTLPAAGHDWGETEYTWTPTETGYTCTAKRVCQKDKAHVETETVTAAYAVVTEPTCLTDGLGRYRASFAADWAEGASKDVPISALDHDWGAWKSNGDGTHTRVCGRDDSHTETDTCSGGTATCTELATCTTCGGTYGELAAHDFTAEVAEEDYLKSEATCTEAAVYYKSCTACGLASEDTFQSGDPLGHDYDTEWSQDETHHWHVCQRCQDIADLEAHTASGWITDKAATAKSDGEKHKECTVCGYILETDTIPATGSKTKPGKKDNTKSSTKTRIKTNAPKTGDDSTLLLWMALLGVSCVGVTGVVRYGGKRKDNE